MFYAKLLTYDVHAAANELINKEVESLKQVNDAIKKMSLDHLACFR